MRSAILQTRDGRRVGVKLSDDDTQVSVHRGPGTGVGVPLDSIVAQGLPPNSWGVFDLDTGGNIDHAQWFATQAEAQAAMGFGDGWTLVWTDVYGNLSE